MGLSAQNDVQTCLATPCWPDVMRLSPEVSYQIFLSLMIRDAARGLVTILATHLVITPAAAETVTFPRIMKRTDLASEDSSGSRRTR